LLRAGALFLEAALEIAVAPQSPNPRRRAGALDHQKHGTELDGLAERERCPLPGAKRGLSHARSVGAAEVLDRELLTHVDARVTPGNRGIVDAHIRVIATADHERA